MKPIHENHCLSKKLHHMKYTYLFTFIFSVFAFQSIGQSSARISFDYPDELPVLTTTADARPFAATITAADMESYLTVLASDEFEGRETGTEGQRKAADFIAAHFEKLGLPQVVETEEGNSYFQKIAFTAESWKNGQIKLTINGTKYRHLSDFYSFPSTNANLDGELQMSQVVFMGYGIDDEKYSDYKGVDVKDKIVMVYAGEPVNKKKKSYLTGSKEERSSWTTDWRKKLEAAYAHGAKAVLIIDPQLRENISKYRSTLLSSEMKMGEGGQPEGKYVNNMFISSTVAKAIVGGKYDQFIKLRDGIKKKGKPAHLTLPANVALRQQKNVKQLIGSNVLGFIEGTDEKLKDEVVVVSAHYDHLGKRGESIYNGADDNGSGTSAVMDIAQAFAQAKEEGKGPRRSVLCLLVSGEEKGLLGSEYYAEHPIFPLENTVADVNVDMIGRTDKFHEGNPNYIYVIGADRLSTQLHNINVAANAKYAQLDLDYKYNADDDPNRFYYRSDHYNFAKKGIPSIFYFSGTHKDYHRTSDTVEKIMFEKMEKVAHLIFYTTWELANRDERIIVDVEGRN